MRNDLENFNLRVGISCRMILQNETLLNHYAEQYGFVCDASEAAPFGPTRENQFQQFVVDDLQYKGDYSVAELRAIGSQLFRFFEG